MRRDVAVMKLFGIFAAVVPALSAPPMSSTIQRLPALSF